MKRLEQQNSYLTEFHSTVTVIKFSEKYVLIALAESAFYPTSGGQSFDTGTLNGQAVLDVFKEEKQDEIVWHKLESFPFDVGDTVHGMINWERRYKHMQRHTAEHMLAQAFIRVKPDFETHAVNLGQKVCTIDIAGQPSEENIVKAEVLVNQAAYQNLAVKTFEVDESTISHYPLRRTPKVSGTIRIVQIGNYDTSACGGTHLGFSAEALPIKIISFEKIKGNLTRIYFMAGQEAYEDYALKHTLSTQIAKSFSSSVEQLPERITQLREELKTTKGQLLTLQERLAEKLADTLLQQADKISKGRLVKYLLEPSQRDLLQPLSKTLANQPDVIALLGIADDKASLIFARSKNVDVAMNTLLAEALPLIEGKGGGNAEKAQGNGSNIAGITQALEHAKKLLEI